MTTEQTFQIVLAVFGAAGFWEIIKLILTRIFKKKDKHDEKEDLQTLALQGLLHEALERRCLEALAYGQMTPAMHETIDALWEPYQRMGLNGTGKALHDKVLGLDITND